MLGLGVRLLVRGLMKLFVVLLRDAEGVFLAD